MSSKVKPEAAKVSHLKGHLQLSDFLPHWSGKDSEGASISIWKQQPGQLIMPGIGIEMEIVTYLPPICQFSFSN